MKNNPPPILLFITLLLFCQSTLGVNTPPPTQQNTRRFPSLSSSDRSQRSIVSPVGMPPINPFDASSSIGIPVVEQQIQAQYRRPLGFQGSQHSGNPPSYPEEGFQSFGLGKMNQRRARPLPKGYIPIAMRFDLTHMQPIQTAGIAYEDSFPKLDQLIEKYVRRSKWRLDSRGHYFSSQHIPEEELLKQYDPIKQKQRQIMRINEPTATEVQKDQELKNKLRQIKKEKKRLGTQVQMYQQRKIKCNQKLDQDEKTAKQIKIKCKRDIRQLKKKAKKSQNPDKYEAKIQQLTESCTGDLAIIQHLIQNQYRALQILRKQIKEDEDKLKIQNELYQKNAQAYKQNQDTRIKLDLAQYQAKQNRQERTIVKSKQVQKRRRELLLAIQKLQRQINAKYIQEKKKQIKIQNQLKKQYLNMLEKQQRMGIKCFYQMKQIPVFSFRPLKITRPVGRLYFKKIQQQFKAMQSPNLNQVIHAILFLQSHMADGTNLIGQKQCEAMRGYITNLPLILIDDQYTKVVKMLRRLYKEYCFAWGLSNDLPHIMDLSDIRLTKPMNDKDQFVILNNQMYRLENYKTVLVLTQEKDQKQALFLQKFKRKIVSSDPKHFMAPYSLNHLRCINPKQIKRRQIIEGEGGVDKYGNTYVFERNKWVKSTMEQLRTSLSLYRNRIYKQQYQRIRNYLLSNDQSGQIEKRKSRQERRRRTIQQQQRQQQITGERHGRLSPNSQQKHDEAQRQQRKQRQEQLEVHLTEEQRIQLQAQIQKVQMMIFSKMAVNKERCQFIYKEVILLRQHISKANDPKYIPPLKKIQEQFTNLCRNYFA